MKVILEALRIPPYGGVRTAAIGWIKALAEFSPDAHYIALLGKQECELQNYPNVEQMIIRTPGQLLPRIHLQILLPRLVYKHNAKIVHFLRNLAVIVPNAKVVVNVNDLTRLILPNAYSRWDICYWNIINRRVLQHYVESIICISDQTRSDLQKWLGSDSPRANISTIYPAIHDRYQPVDKEVYQPIKVKYNLPDQFVLYVGGLAQNKNVRTLVKAFATLQKLHTLPHKLVIVGGQYHTNNDTDVYTIAQSLLADQVIFTGVLSDYDLLLLYNAADVFVFPSIYEGFGLVPLEAITCGVPVIASPVGSLPEVLGQAALWVNDPLDVDGYAKAISQVLTNKSLQKEMRQKGLNQSQKFTWEDAAKQTMLIYQGLVGEHI